MVLNNEIILNQQNLYTQTYLCNKNEPEFYYKIYDKNWTFVEFDHLSKQFIFLYWFETDGVSMIYVNNKSNMGCIKKTVIKYKKDKILGLGTDKLPLFSFGSTMCKIFSGPFEMDMIGVGHIKIIKNFNYDPSSKIKHFLDKINIQLREKFKDKYIQHNSYHYLMFFFRLLKKNNKYGMLISDSFLPVNLDEKNHYKFSIVFPMGVFSKNDKINITCGEGDYYNIILSFNLQYIKNLCIHNVKHFDAEQYDYHYLCYQDSTFKIMDNLII